MKTLLGLAAATVTALGALSLVPAQAENTDGDNRAELKKCFRTDDVDRYNPVDSRTMVIETYNKHFFKLKLVGACMGIEDAMQIGLRSRSGQSTICGAFDAEILYSENGIGGRLSKCSVVDVIPITKAEADKLEGVEASASTERDS